MSGGIDFNEPAIGLKETNTARSRRRARSKSSARRQTESHDDGEGNWLLSYADMMTLLFGFFVMLQSFSTIDPAKFERMKKETTRVFGGEYKVPFDDLTKKLQTAVTSKHLENQVAFFQTDAGIEISFRGALFFDSGSVQLRPQARDLLKTIIPIIAEGAKDFGIVVEGHTDDTPIRNEIFGTNWELSSTRACRVLRMFEESGFAAARLKAIGWGKTHPIVPNLDPQGVPIEANRAQNRRVVIKVLKTWEN
jgi:chemotaxis protein MotB